MHKFRTVVLLTLLLLLIPPTFDALYRLILFFDLGLVPYVRRRYIYIAHGHAQLWAFLFTAAATFAALGFIAWGHKKRR